MSNKSQEQKVRKGGTAIQAAGNITITSTGLSYSDVRQIAYDVFEANFSKILKKVRRIANRNGLKLGPVAPRLLLPMLEVGLLEDDETNPYRAPVTGITEKLGASDVNNDRCNRQRSNTFSVPHRALSYPPREN
jgi:hypothetical protein